MAHVTHQTVRLASGKHVSPAHGVCVLELASMLAGEAFTDYPRSVSNVIGTFVRGYNDMLDDRRRQDLYEYAAKLVGTAAGRSTEIARAELLRAWGDNIRSGRLFGRLRRRLGRPPARLDPVLPEPSALYALRGIRRVTDETHRAVLELVDALIDVGSPSVLGKHAAADPAPTPTRGLGWQESSRELDQVRVDGARSLENLGEARA
jgi:hypothetical protein